MLSLSLSLSRIHTHTYMHTHTKEFLKKTKPEPITHPIKKITYSMLGPNQYFFFLFFFFVLHHTTLPQPGLGRIVEQEKY